ncbi:MAG TPA: GNAT family N-acetyltransferase [Paenisporosarcina sp.]|nr:GNAT family N-acetyltransferase [Paenisporosarcina sp.]
MEFEYKELGHDAYAFVYEKDGQTLGEITWTMLGDVMVMDHTFVSPELRSKGVAKQLLDRSAEFAREKSYKMEAVCSYVVSAFNESDKYEDLKA